LFIGYEADEVLPDHSTLSKALDRFGEELFDELFQRSIRQCQQSGLIEGKILHLDATTIRADIDRDCVGKVASSDSDARFGRFPDGTIQQGYKQQTVADGPSLVIVAVAVIPANASEHETAIAVIGEAIKELDHPPEVVCADGAYASGENRAALEAKGIRFVSPPQPVPHQGGEYFTVDRFIYNELADEFVCPAGKCLGYAGRTGRKGWQRKYRCKQKMCRSCVLRNQCTPGIVRCVTVGKDHAALIRLRADSKTEDFQPLYRGRAPAIEGVFAEAKERHGLRRAWRRGLSKMRIQCLLIAAVINFKRLIMLLLYQATGSQTLRDGLNRYWMTIATFYQEIRVVSHHTPSICPR
jgi:hypothetical protein